MVFSDYIVYVDESGDHGLVSINPQNPVFVLTFCVFRKDEYRISMVPAVQALKFKYWGHDGVILHGHEIRKSHGSFSILLNGNVRGQFIEDMNALIEAAPVVLIAAAIDKQRHVEHYQQPDNPYKIALTYCMERLQMFLNERHATGKTFIMVERRGQKEDADLELEFRRIADGGNQLGPMPHLDVRFMDKKHNSAGLQMADLLAYPIARHVIRPDQPNRAYERVEPKFRRSATGQVKGYGLKIFP
ncbi:MAG: DUF3800 domain-containing protein [Devosia sp.]